MRMPDGRDFDFWDDRTKYRRVLHVAAGHPSAADDNPGTDARPLRTIGAAAVRLQPGEKAVIHGGVYRETVRPPRGGTGPDAMIAYGAAPGEAVFLRGSEPWTDAVARFRPTDNARNAAAAPAGVTIWMGDLPDALFPGYNPFLINNTSGVLMAYGHVWTHDELKRYLLKRGLVFADGQALVQVYDEADLATGDGRYCVFTGSRTVHFRLPGDADPRTARLEITTREQAFMPVERGLAYIRVSGLVLEQCASAMPLVGGQRGALSAGAGHHWIVEDCAIRHCNGTGMDIGTQDPRLAEPDVLGRHVIRRNRISDCGIAGLCGLGNPADTLIEDNVFERIGWLRLEKMFECAALKMHNVRRSLIRRNVFRRISHACGIWLDYLCGCNRVSGNVFAEIESIFGGLHIESSFEPHWVDGNVFWDMRSWRAAEHGPESPMRGGHGVFADSSDRVTIAHNLFGPSVSYAVACHFKQADRIVAGRVGMNRGHAILNNVFVGCAKRVLLGRAEENVSNGNLFDRKGDAASLCVYRPEPPAVLTLAAWRESFGLDRQSAQATITASFNPDLCTLAWQVGSRDAAELRLATDPPLLDEGRYAAPGPFAADAWAQTLRSGAAAQDWRLGDGARVEIVRDVEYKRVGPRSLTLDLYLPADAPRPLPVVMWIPGGGWRGCGKGNCRGAWLAARGFAVAALVYRVVREAHLPAAIEDCQAAARFLRAHAAEHGLDPERLAAFGDSAGGHLVQMLGVTDSRGTEPWPEASSRVRAVVSVFGVSDLTEYPPSGTAEEDLFGTLGPERPARVREASPLHRADADAAPMLLIHGDKDNLVPLGQSVRLRARLAELGVPAELQVVRGAGHEGRLYDDPALRHHVAGFLTRHLA
jgi:acetyl esterase/lipase